MAIAKTTAFVPGDSSFRNVILPCNVSLFILSHKLAFLAVFTIFKIQFEKFLS